MRLPFATILLAGLMLSVYLWSSEGSLYPTEELTNRFAFGFPNPGAILFHLFFHVGLIHFLGNLVPLLLFAFLAETALSTKDVFLVFLSAGLIAGFFFSLLNPSVLLVGASAGVSGLMAAAAASSPKKGLALLLLTPVTVSLLVVPFADAFSDATASTLLKQKQAFDEKASAFEAQNQPAQAAQARSQALDVQGKALQISEGKQREKNTPADFFVHAIGAAIGFFFVALLRKERFHQGLAEVEELMRLLRQPNTKTAKRPEKKRYKKKQRRQDKFATR